MAKPVVFSRERAEEIRDAVRLVNNQYANDRPGGGTPPNSVPAAVRMVRVTSTTQDSGRYPGKVVLYDATAKTYSDFEGDIWIVPSNAETLAVQRYGAKASGDANGRPVYQVVGGASGGSITVEEVDGNPSITGVTKIQFDSADGFTISNPLSGVARIDLDGYSGAQTIVTAISCDAGSLIATTKVFTWLKGLLISVV